MTARQLIWWAFKECGFWDGPEDRREILRYYTIGLKTALWAGHRGRGLPASVATEAIRALIDEADAARGSPRLYDRVAYPRKKRPPIVIAFPAAGKFPGEARGLGASPLASQMARMPAP